MTILIDKRLDGAIINGTNQTNRKSIRVWSYVKCTGNYRLNRFGNKLAEVIDPSTSYETRWLNFHNNFTGDIVYPSKVKRDWDKGIKSDQLIKTDKYEDSLLNYKLEIVRIFFNMGNEEWAIFLSNTDLQTKTNLIDECVKESGIVFSSLTVTDLTRPIIPIETKSFRPVNEDLLNTPVDEQYVMLASDFESSDGMIRYN